jgi:hypothetical protein
MIGRLAVRSAAPILIALLLTALTAAFAAPAASAGPGRACAYDRPCIDQLFFSTKARINATWTGDWDAYNVRWTVNRGGRIIDLGQSDVGAAKIAKLDVRAGDRGHQFRFSVQGCDRRFLAPSVCSPWETNTIVPVPSAGG